MLTPNFEPFPIIQTEHLVLRRISISDVAEIFNMRSDTRVMKYIDRPIAESLDDALILIAKIDESLSLNDGITWGIALNENQELIGTIGFWRIDKPNYRAEIGYLMKMEWQGKGLMQEAMSVVISYGFGNMQLHSIEANVNPENILSKKILEKNGFVQEAYYKENYFHNGSFLDSAIYSLLTPKENSL